MQTTTATPYTAPVVHHELREYKADGGLKLNFHYGQIEAWNSTARFVAIISGTQGGKTSFAPHWLLREIQMKGNGDYIYATPTFALLDKKALPEFREIFEKRAKLGKFYAGKMKFIFSEAGMKYIHGVGNYDVHKPTTVFFGYASKPDSLESMTAKAAVLDEAGQDDFKLDSWFAILRRLAINQGRALLATTPYNFNWLYTHVYKRWLSGDKDYHVVNFPSTANPMFPMEEALRAKRTMPKWKYEMFYLGQFTRPAGLIYDNFEFGKNTCAPFIVPPHWKRVIGVDFGGQNKAATYWANKPNTNKWYLYKEYYPQMYKPIRQHTMDIMRREPTVVINDGISQMTYDDDLFTIVAGASGERQWRIEMSQYGLYSQPSFVHLVELGIDKVYDAVSLGNIIVFDTCVQTIDEFNTYSRLTNQDGDVIPNTIQNKETFHLLDTVRYGASWFANAEINPEYNGSIASVFHPDGEQIDLDELMNDEDIDLDNPRVQQLIRRRKAESNSLMAKHDRFKVDEAEDDDDINYN